MDGSVSHRGPWASRPRHELRGRTRLGVAAAVVAVAAVACGPPAPPSLESASADTHRPGEWLVLFDGTSTEHWRGFRRDVFPDDGWQVDGGALTPRSDGTVVDIITRRTFRSYELELEWRVAPNGNSGIFVHVTEDHPEVWHTGPEFQVLDDERHPDGLTSETSAGAIYGLVAPVDKQIRPAGEWNHARIVVRGPRVEHALNGRIVLATDISSPAFRDRVAASTFATMPDFATHAEGHVALQHSSVSPLKAPVWFRDVRIRELPDG